MSEEQSFQPIGVVEVAMSADADPGTVYLVSENKLRVTRNWGHMDDPEWEDITPPGTRVVYDEYIDKLSPAERTRLLQTAREIGGDMAKQYFGLEENVMGDLPTEQDLAVRDFLIEALSVLRSQKPEERSSKARYYAVAITDLEKVCAYFNAYVCVGIENE